MVNETSTPKRVSFYGEKRTKNISTPLLRRKSMIADAIQKDPDADIPNVEDDEEDRIRRRSIAQVLRKSNSLTPNLNLSESSSSPLQNKSVSAIESHFKKCITLFTTNKINAENAWHLVGYMDYLKLQLRQHIDPNQLLQTASSAVEVGAKILSVQIDDIHCRTLKLANQLSKVKITGQTEEDQDNDETNYEEMDSDEQGNKKNRKEKKKQTKRNLQKIVVDNDDVLNTEIEPHLLLLTINEKEFSNQMLCSKPIKHFKLLSVIQSKKVLWSDISFKGEKDKIVHPSLHLPPPKSPVEINEKLRDFAVDVFDINKDETINDIDMEQVDCNDGDNPWHIEPHPREMNESIMEDLGIQGEYNEPEPVFLTDMRPTLADITSKHRMSMYLPRNLPSIYDRVWVGPEHWKLKILRKKDNICPNSKVNDAQKAKKPPKVTIPFDLKKLVKKKELFKNDLKLEKNSTKTTRKTLKLNTNLPENMKISPDCILNIEKNVRIKHHGQQSIEHQENLNQSYMYDNQNDADYCNLTSHEPDADGDIHDNDADLDNSFDDYNAIMNEKMETDAVPFALKAKRMDMRKLKGYIWDELSTNLVTNNAKQEIIKPTKLSNIFKTLPGKMPHSMAENLNAPLAFVALLHLANEKDLFIESLDYHEDVVISKMFHK